MKNLKKWTPILEGLGITNPERIAWMSEYAENHTAHLGKMNESNAYANLSNVLGMGSVAAPVAGAVPGIPGDATAGDYGQQLFPVAMKIAAHTIGLDLVAVKPSPGPVIDLMYMDFRYDDTSTTGTNEKPQVFKMMYTDATAYANLKTYLAAAMAYSGAIETVGGLTARVFVNLATFTNVTSPNLEPTGNKQGALEFLGYSRIDGMPIFRAYRQANTASSGGWVYEQAQNTFTATETIAARLAGGFGDTTPIVAPTGVTSGVTVELVSVMEDHIPMFSAGWQNANAPMTRDRDEDTYPGVIAPNVNVKRVQVGTIEVSTAVKRTEIEDIKSQTGIDIMQKLESVLANELAQTISKQIVRKIFELGSVNAASAPATLSTFDTDTMNFLGGENSVSANRKLIQRIMAASNFIATEGRVGPAQYAITNGQIASALQAGAGYTLSPVKNNMSNGQLYPMGTLGDMQIYVDPYMKYGDNRIALGRKNAADQPGIIFVPYLMAQSVQLMSEATFAPRLLLRSRFAVTEVGFFPQKQYFTMTVTGANSSSLF